MSDIPETDTFDEARITWQKLSVNQSWIGVFGDLYVRRYPTLSRLSKDTEAAGVSSSLFDEDDSVHAYDAHGVRSAILKQLVTVEKRGYIRPWYVDAGLFAEKSNLLRAFKEEDIDFIIRLSLQTPKDGNSKFIKESQFLLEKLDPPIPKNEDGSINEFELAEVKELVRIYLQPQIEFFGLLKGLERSLFPLSQQDFYEVLDIIFDPEMADIVFRKRFIEHNKKSHPLIADGHQNTTIKSNFIMKYLAVENIEFYKLRTIMLWLFSFLMHNSGSYEYMRTNGYKVINDIENYLVKNEDNYKQILWDALSFIKFEKVFQNLIHKFRTEYATKAVFSEYARNIYHLLHQRNIAIAPFEKNQFPIHVDVVRYEEKNILVEIGETLIDSLLIKLANEIPEARGMGFAHTQRSIMIKRKVNMEREVAPLELQGKLLEPILEIRECYQIENSYNKIEKLVRKPHDIIAPRGEKYFEEMKDRVEAMKQEIGKDFTEEITDQLDTPQSLVRQFGQEALRFTSHFFENTDNLKYPELYGLVLTMKSVELLFDAATMNILKKRQVIGSLLNEYFLPQIDLLKRIHLEQSKIKSFSKEEDH